MLACQVGQVPGGQCRGIGERLIRVPRDSLDDLDAARFQQEFVVAGAELFCHVACVFARVVARFVKTDGKGLEPLSARLARQRHHGGRVDATRQEEADRHVGYQTELHRIPQDIQSLFDDGFLIRALFGRIRRRPVALLLHIRTLGLQPMARLQPAHAAEDGAGTHHVGIGEIAIQRDGIEALLDQPRVDQRFQFGRKIERALVFQHVERLFAESVAGSEH